MLSTRALVIDGAVALALACALGLVFLLDRASGDHPNSAIHVVETPQPSPEPPSAPPMRLAVTARQYDDMGKLLGQLGSGFPYSEYRIEDLEDASKLARYDVLFLTCGTVPDSWVVGDDLGAGARPGVRLVRLNEEILSRVKEALRGFVAGGGTLYASDWRLEVLRPCFPEIFGAAGGVKGAAQTLTAEVVDAGLRDVLGPSLQLQFDLPGWYPAQLTGDRMTVYLKGTFRPEGDGPEVNAPLLVKVPFEQGTIIFTSFHNETVNSAFEVKLLKFLVFAAVTAREATQVQKTMISGGFKPQKQNLLSASPENPAVTQTYSNTKPGRLRFALSFSNQGAQLKLTVRGPSGQSFVQEGMSSFTIDVPDAPPGQWTYTVTALKMPHSDFPFTLTVGQD